MSFQHFILEIQYNFLTLWIYHWKSISYWDSIKFPYFADTTERGMGGVKETMTLWITWLSDIVCPHTFGWIVYKPAHYIVFSHKPSAQYTVNYSLHIRIFWLPLMIPLIMPNRFFFFFFLYISVLGFDVRVGF